MGEIARHADISRDSYNSIKGLRKEDFTFIELGNFITDLTNFRDPYAFIGSKRLVDSRITKKIADEIFKPEYMALADGLGAATGALVELAGMGLGEISDKLSSDYFKADKLVPAALIGAGAAHFTRPFYPGLVKSHMGVKDWEDQLFGVADDEAGRFGKLALFLDNFGIAFTHIFFANDIVEKEKLREDFPKQLQFGLGDAPDITAAEIKRVFEKFYVQYFPHEHLDLPPFVREPSKRANSQLYRKQGKEPGLIGYLKDQAQYLVEGFTMLEWKWKSSKRTQDRHDRLVELGRLLHAVEDYFFHSNYVEVNEWNEFKKASDASTYLQQNEGFLPKGILKKYIGFTGYDRDVYADTSKQVSNYRILSRRLRFPVYDRNNLLDKKNSLPSADMIYTGSFESTDISNTVAHALKGFEVIFNRWINGILPGMSNLVPNDPANPEFVLLHALVDQSISRRMATDPEYLAFLQNRHREEILDTSVISPYTRAAGNKYDLLIDILYYKNKEINEEARNALKKAFSIDRDFTASINKDLLGVGAFVLQFLSEVQINKMANDVRVEELDRMGYPENTDDIYIGSDNGAIAENIGSHSLLSKDTLDNQPLYENALSLAKFASCALSNIIIEELNQNDDTSVGLDWGVIIRHYVRYPKALRSMWEVQVINHYKRKAAVPAYADIEDKPPLIKLKISDPSKLLITRRRLTKRTALEQAYIKLEKEVDF